MGTKWIENHADILFDNGTIDQATHRSLKFGNYTPVLQRIGPDGKVQNIDLNTVKDMKTGGQIFTPQQVQVWRDKG